MNRRITVQCIDCGMVVSVWEANYIRRGRRKRCELCADQKQDSRGYLPTPEEIRVECLKIQAERAAAMQDETDDD